MEDKKIRVRIAPSPTGDPHVGTAYIALFNYIFAKQNNGDFIIRIEDTDRTRFNEQSEREILEYLKWLGLNWKEGPDIGGSVAPYKQSERKDIYKKYVDQLLESGKAYKCFCTEERLTKLKEFQKSRKLPPGYDGKCRNLEKDEIRDNLLNEKNFVVRLRVPKEGKTTVKDVLREDIEFDNVKIDDQVLLKSDGMPTYHLASVVDDKLMGITHVIRAEEWIPSTPKHVLLYQAFGWDAPKWIHMPILRNADRSKISKRKNAVSLKHYKEQGYLKEALINFLGLMGWHPKSGEEVFDLDFMARHFNFNDVHLGGPVFDVAKLNWLNREYIRSYDNRELCKLINISFDTFTEKVIEECKDAYTLNELKEKVNFFTSNPLENLNSSEDRDKMLEVIKREETSKVIEYLKSNIKDIEEAEEAKQFIENMKESLNLNAGKILPVLRILVIGAMRGVEAAKILTIYSKDEILRRMDLVLNGI